jgi:endo-1,4-beta-xylanase
VALAAVGISSTRSDRAADTPAPARSPRAAPLIGVAVGWSALTDPRSQRLIGRRYGSVTPENEMKMNALQPERGRFSFARADAIVALAERNGQEVRGHALVWHRQIPAWITGRAWTRPELLGVLREHVRAVVSHFRGRVAEWDVINEPLAAGGGLRDNIWLRVIGPDYIDEALRAARASDPDARLLVNEFNAERPGPKLEGLRALVRGLRERGTPLDGVGLQGHARTDWHPTPAELTATMRGFTLQGLTVSVTELDVATDRSPGSLAERLALQSKVYGIYGAVCAGTPGCRGLTVWGLTDPDSWLGPQALALPFDANYSPKPAWGALVTAWGGSANSDAGSG